MSCQSVSGVSGDQAPMSPMSGDQDCVGPGNQAHSPGHNTNTRSEQEQMPSNMSLFSENLVKISKSY